MKRMRTSSVRRTWLQASASVSRHDLNFPTLCALHKTPSQLLLLLLAIYTELYVYVGIIYAYVLCASIISVYI